MAHIVEWGGKIGVFDYHWQVDQWMEAMAVEDEYREYERQMKEKEATESKQEADEQERNSEAS